MQNLVLVLLVLIFLKLFKDNIGILLSKKFLLSKSQLCVNPGFNFLIFIPIYNITQNDLISCIKHFSKIKRVTSIFFIATRKDKKINIDSYYSQIRSIQNNKINLLIYPKKSGVKSDQINFGVKTVFGEKKINPHKTFILIYDIDSRPNLDTVKQLSFDKDLNWVNVYQQSAVFLNNFFLLKNNLNGELVRLFSVEQCRFTFVHEIPRHILNFFTLKKKLFLNNFIYAHCVGHGLIIRGSFIKKYPLPSFYPEDMFYGFMLNIIKEPIKLIKTLDESNMPDDFREIFLQRANWFIGPSYGLGYTSFFRKKYADKIANNKIKIFFLNIKSVYLCLKWMTTTLVFVFLVFTVFLEIWTFKTLALLSIGLYLLSYLNVILVLKKVKHSYRKNFIKLRFLEQIKLVFFSPIHLIVHSVTAYYKIYFSVKHKNISRI